MSKPDVWMPLYIADYLGDTGRLTTEQHGAYLLLIMDYWRNGAPPDEDAVLATITKLSPEQWAKHRPSIARLFQVADGKWGHKRIEEELAEAWANAEKNSARAKQAAEKRWAKERREKDAPSTPPSTPQCSAEGVLEQCPSPSPCKTDRQTGACGPELLTIGAVMQTCIEAGARLNPANLHVRQVAGEIVYIGATAEDLREAIRKAQLAKQGKAWGLPYVRVIVGEVIEKRKSLATGGPERPAGGNGEAGGASRKLSLGERATLARQQAEAAEAQREAHGEPLGAHESPLRAQVVERVR